MPTVEHYGNSGDLARALDIAEDAVDVLERTWGRFHAVVRLAALVAGQTAGNAPHADATLLRRAHADLDSMTAKVDAIVAEPQRGVREPTTEVIEETNTETWAWDRRLRAEPAPTAVAVRPGVAAGPGGHGRRVAGVGRSLRALRPPLRDRALPCAPRRGAPGLGRRRRRPTRGRPRP